MKQEQLNAIKERVEKATPGPWIVAPEKCGPEGQGVYESEGFGCICEVGDPYPRGNNRPQENMEFIAHAREDVPVLVAEIERLQKELAKTKERYEIMEKATFKASGMLKEARNENEHLRETLCFYGDLSKYVIIAHMNKETDLAVDLGEKARQALGGKAHE